MKYCRKCEWEYEDGTECLCRVYRKHMEAGKTNLVPMHWKFECWEGYLNNPQYCEHYAVNPRMDGSYQCRLCGVEIAKGYFRKEP